MSGRAGTLAIGALGCVLATAGLAAAAERCHRDLAGTRSFTLNADVTGYRFSGKDVVVEWSRAADCAGIAVWNYSSDPRGKASASCQQSAPRPSAGRESKLVASDRSHVVRVILAPASADLPDRLLVLDRATKRRVASWPLIARPTRVGLRGDIAILSAARRDALYALRISDGRIAVVGVTRPDDRPLIGAAGVLYQDDLDRSKHRTAPSERTLKLLPLSTVRQELARPYVTVRKYMSYSRPSPGRFSALLGADGNRSAIPATKPAYRGADPPRRIRLGKISAISMDGPRVAIAERDPLGRCDRVLFWNVPWHYVTRLTRASGATCLPTHPAGGITDVAIGGSRAVWTTSYGRETRVLAASITDCQEWVVGRPASGVERVSALAADDALLAYAIRSSKASARRDAHVAIVQSRWRPLGVARSESQVSALSADGDQLALLYDSGIVEIRSGLRGVALPGAHAFMRSERHAATIRVGQARAISLRTRQLAVLTQLGTLDVYQTTPGRRVRSWRVPANAASLDLHYGIALLTAGRDVFAVDVETGRTAHLMRAPGRVSAELESPGAAIAFNTPGGGHLRFLPMSWIEARLR